MSSWATSSWQGAHDTNRKREGEPEKDPLEGVKAGLSDVKRPAYSGQALLPLPPSPLLFLSLPGPYRNSPPRHIILRKSLAMHALHCCRATADGAETQTCDCVCWHRSMCVQVVLFPHAFCAEQKELLSVYCVHHQLVRSEHFVL